MDEKRNGNPYTEIATFREGVEGGEVVGIITARKFGGVTRLSFSLQREYANKEGERVRAPWFDSRHIDAIDAVLDQIAARFQEEESRRTESRSSRRAAR
mgnify:FL=1